MVHVATDLTLGWAREAKAPRLAVRERGATLILLDDVPLLAANGDECGMQSVWTRRLGCAGLD